MKNKYLSDVSHKKILKHWKPKQQWRTTGGKQFVDMKTHTRGSKTTSPSSARSASSDKNNYYSLSAVDLLS
jgi:hypothetical protein